MPLTEKGKEIMSSMKEQYGEKKGEQVFYASANKGTITGVHDMENPSPSSNGMGGEGVVTTLDAKDYTNPYQNPKEGPNPKNTQWHNPYHGKGEGNIPSGSSLREHGQLPKHEFGFPDKDSNPFDPNPSPSKPATVTHNPKTGASIIVPHGMTPPTHGINARAVKPITGDEQGDPTPTPVANPKPAPTTAPKVYEPATPVNTTVKEGSYSQAGGSVTLQQMNERNRKFWDTPGGTLKENE